MNKTKSLDKNTHALLVKLIKESKDIQKCLDKDFKMSSQLLGKYSELDKQEIEDWWTDCFYNGRNLKDTLASMGIKFK